MIPGDAIVQSNLIDSANYFNVINMLYSGRAMATDGELDCGAVFGGDPALCANTQKIVRELFVNPAPLAAEAKARCQILGIEYLAVSDSDAAWQDRNGWVWTLPRVTGEQGLLSNSGASEDARLRVVQCGTAPGSPP